MTRVPGIVYRAIATQLIHTAGYTKQSAHTGAVTLVRRFGGALNRKSATLRLMICFAGYFIVVIDSWFRQGRIIAISGVRYLETSMEYNIPAGQYTVHGSYA